MSLSKSQLKLTSFCFLLLLSFVLSLTAFVPVAIAQSSTTGSDNTPLRTFNGPPSLTAKAALAVDVETGRILYSKNSRMSLPMASTTKIMTALTLLSIPGVNLNDFTVVVQDDLVGEANMGLLAGDRLRVIELLYGSLLKSANDASTALARYGGSKLPGSGDPVAKFVAEMNRKAKQLGMENSNFANPHGLDDPAHYSSAYDLAIAGWNALQNPTIAGIVKQSQASINGYSFTNITNFIRRYPGATGIKPGETENAGLCIVASANRFGKNAIVVLLNSPGMRTESDELMDYAFAQILAAEKKETPATASFGYIGLPDTGKLRSYSLMVNNLQANLNETLRYLVTLQRLFGGHTLSQRD